MDAAVAKVLGWTSVGWQTMYALAGDHDVVPEGRDLRGVPPAPGYDIAFDVGAAIEASVPPYSTNDASAWEAVKQLAHRWDFDINRETMDGKTTTHVSVWQGDDEVGWSDWESMAAAVCEAILFAHEAGGETE